MKDRVITLSRKYTTALKKHLAQGTEAALPTADGVGGLGQQAMAAGLQTLDLAKIHEKALRALFPPSDSSRTADGVVKRAADFFAQAIVPIEITHRAALGSKASLEEVKKTLRRRVVDLAAANRRFKQEMMRRQAAEQSLGKTKQHYAQLLNDSHRMQEQLRHLTRELLRAQEEERKAISRELHDEIAQILTGINVHLATLKAQAAINTRGLKKKIADTQKLVEKSVNAVHRFARELRPTVLDDLGLIPALHAHLKDFMKRTGIRVHLSAFSGVEQLKSPRRTILYRVVQSALNNVAQHAQASHVALSLQKLKDVLQMEITDNGKGFDVERVLFAVRHKRLGVLGMRERVDMVGGTFDIKSAPGRGTTIRVTMPFVNSGGGKKSSFNLQV